MFAMISMTLEKRYQSGDTLKVALIQKRGSKGATCSQKEQRTEGIIYC